MVPENPDSKAQWRALAKKHRAEEAALLAQQTHQLNERLGAWLTEHQSSMAGGWIVVYDALPGELSLAGIEHDPQLDRIALTRTPESGFDLTLHPADSQREPHRYGYTQPVVGSPVIRDSDVAVVLVPGLIFSIQGHRLGWGAGYYDRLLGRLPDRVLRVGISDGFIVDRLPSDAHDVAMTHIATPSGVEGVPLRPRTTAAAP